MTESAVLTRPGDEDDAPRPCPTWCAGELRTHQAEAHYGKRVELPAWDGGPTPGTPFVSAEIAQLFEQQDAGEAPKVWLCAYGDLELAEDEIDGFAAAVERFALEVRGLKRELAMARLGTVGRAAIDGRAVDEPPTSAATVTMPCPPWCALNDQPHLDRWPEDRGHYGAETVIELSLAAPSRGCDDEPVPATLTVIQEQRAFADVPEIDLSIEGRWCAYCRLSLGEARELHAALGKLINEAAAHARPGFLPPLDELLAGAGARVLEDPDLDCQSWGYAIGDAETSGKAWVCVPEGLSAALREEYVRNLLAELDFGPRTTLCNDPRPILLAGDQPARAAITSRAQAA